MFVAGKTANIMKIGGKIMSHKMNRREQLIADTKVIIEQYDYKLTLRQIFYRLLSKQQIDCNKYKYLSSVLVYARKNNLIPYNAICDKTRSNEITIEMLIDEDIIYKSALKQAFILLTEYELDRWLYQPYKIIVVVEKQALETMFSIVTRSLGVTLIVNRGYNSYTQIKNIALKLSENCLEDRALRFLLFGDFDPSGIDIMRNFEKQITEEGVNAVFETVALTKQQINEYQLPSAPTKITDKRRKKFIEKHGDNIVELDALEPNILQKLITDSVLKYFNQQIYEQEVLPVQEHYRKVFLKRLIKNPDFIYKEGEKF